LARVFHFFHFIILNAILGSGFSFLHFLLRSKLPSNIPKKKLFILNVHTLQRDEVGGHSSPPAHYCQLHVLQLLASPGAVVSGFRLLGNWPFSFILGALVLTLACKALATKDIRFTHTEQIIDTLNMAKIVQHFTLH